MKKQQTLSRENGMKHPFLLLLTVLCISFFHYTEAKAQSTATQPTTADTLINENNVSEPVYDMADQLPEYPGGIQALLQYIAQNTKYPQELQALGVQGRVIVQFVVRSNGQVSNAKVHRGIHPDLDKESLRVISAMPLWIPGKKDGKAVNVKFTVPINFRSTPPPTNKVVETQQTDSIEDKVFMNPQKLPEFPGGVEKLSQYMKQHLTYWKQAVKQKEEGRVVVTFVVRKDGKVSDARVIRTVSPTLDAEAVRIISNMPLWTPAEDQGVPVSARLTMPVMFKLH